MGSKTKIGIIICDRYRRCAGGKCLRAMRNREGAFSLYPDCISSQFVILFDYLLGEGVGMTWHNAFEITWM